MTESEQLQHAITALEAQRSTLGDAVVEAALVALRQKLAALAPAPESTSSPPPFLRSTDQSAVLVNERKLVTIFFADLSGFTALAERMDPEAVHELMNACFARLVPVIERYGGTIDKFIGDEIMALFGAPVTRENDAERAIRAALDMQEALAALNHERGTDLGIHFGINSGLVIAGGIGPGKRQDYSVMGDAVNLAARLEDASERGQILVGPDTYRLTASLFDFETLGPLSVKGKAEPIVAYRVVGVKTRPNRLRGLDQQGLHSPVVGRSAEFATILKVIDRFQSGQGSLLTIIGEAGMGKSRLIAEAYNVTTRWPRMARTLWLRGHALSFSQSLSYWPFQEILRTCAGITEHDSEAAAWGKLATQVTRLFREQTPEILPYLASLLNLGVRDEYAERVQYLDGEALGKQIFLSSRQFFERLAHTRPLVLIFEDMHWMDESSTYLVEHLLPLVERAPILFIGLTRPELQTPGGRLYQTVQREYTVYYTEIRLTRLSQESLTQLAQNLLDIENLSARARTAIISKAEGNPFFLEEVLRTLIDTNAVVRDPVSGRWRAEAQIEEIAIPDTIHGIIMARVDRLHEEVKQVLRMAAVIGRSFFYRVLRAVAETDQQLDYHLTALQQSEIIRQKRIASELTYLFRHALAQEATYESILLQKRRELHARVGQVIETLFAERLEEFYGQLTYHYARAEVWEKAHAYLLKAGDQAGRIAADSEALTHYQQALAAYNNAFGDTWDPLQRAALERKIGEAFYRRGEHTRAIEHFRLALKYLGKPLPTSRWETRRAIAKELLQQLGYRWLPGFFLKPHTPSAGAAVEEETRLYTAMEWIDGFANLERFVLVTLKNLNVAERNNFMYGIATGAASVGLTCDFVSAFGLADRYHRHAMTLAERMQSPLAVANVSYAAAVHENYWGKVDAALDHARQAAMFYHEVGDLRSWGSATVTIVCALMYRGEFGEAKNLSQTLLRSGQEGADLQVWCWGLFLLGEIHRCQGQVADAIRCEQQAIALADRIPDYLSRVVAGGELGQCYVAQGELSLAMAVLDATQRIRLEHRVSAYAASHFCSSRAAAQLLAVEQAAEAEKAQCLHKAKQACASALRQGKAYRPGWPEALRLRGTYEWLRGNTASAYTCWHKALAKAGKMGMRYEIGKTHQEIGKRTGDPNHQEKAQTIWAEMGVQREHAKPV